MYSDASLERAESDGAVREMQQEEIRGDQRRWIEKMMQCRQMMEGPSRTPGAKRAQTAGGS